MKALSLTARSLRLAGKQGDSTVSSPPAGTVSLLRTETADVIVTELGDAIATEAN